MGMRGAAEIELDACFTLSFRLASGPVRPQFEGSRTRLWRCLALLTIVRGVSSFRCDFSATVVGRICVRCIGGAASATLQEPRSR